MLVRFLKNIIKAQLDSHKKVIILFGPRQVGKTTLVEEIINELGAKTIVANGEEAIYQDIFGSRNFYKMKEFIDDAALLFIDEAQHINDIGINIKILHDKFKDLKIILSGSSSFELANKTQEPLTGRKITHLLYPLSILEIRQTQSIFDIKQEVSNYLKYGLYPEVYTLSSITAKRDHLLELTNAYLYKDVLLLAGIKNPKILRDLLKLLALQVGQTVSINKLANALNITSETVNNYIDVLEKAFVVYRVHGYSRNLSKEISKMDKILFYDVGVRNAILNDFKEIKDRNDAGSVWENFLITERRKRNAYLNVPTDTYFWRTYTGAEIDYIEAKDGNLNAFEIKFNDKIVKAPSTWVNTYKNTTFQTINNVNWVEWVLEQNNEG